MPEPPKPSAEKFIELFPSAEAPQQPISPVSKFITFTSSGYIPEKPPIPPSEPEAPKPAPTPPPAIVNFEPKFIEINELQAMEFIQQGNFVGLDSKSVRRIVLTHPIALLNAISQKLSDIILFIHRAGWSELTPQQRNAMPWLCAALDWGLSADEMFNNAHALPSEHPLKNDCLNAAKYMEEWENQHHNMAWITKDSKALDRLIGQPVLIGSDGWPLNRLDSEGNEFTMDQLYEDTILIYHRASPKLSPSLKNLIQKTALKSLQDGRLALIEPE